MENHTKNDVRIFASGATRDSDKDKLEISGFFSPLAMLRYAEYMHEHRKLGDGTMRSSRNWRKGIPSEVYQESLARHHLDAMLHLDGFPMEAREDLEKALCGIIFNAQGLLHELILEHRALGRGRTE